MINNDIEQLDDPFRGKFKAFLAACAADGIDVRMGEGRRTPETQLLYFLQGRLATFFGENKNLLAEYHALRKRVGLFPVTDAEAISKKITWTLNSNHFNGNAADILVYTEGKINWNPGDAVWEKIAVIAENNGLASGHRWPSPKKDSPHIELRVI